MLLSYYDSVKFEELLYYPENGKFNHFRFVTKRGYFQRMPRKFYTKIELLNFIRNKQPKEIFYTPVKWLDSVKVAKTKEELDVMISSPLFFDLDFGDVPFDKMRNLNYTMGVKLINFIQVEYGRNPSSVVFSGNKGIHIYYLNWDDEILMEKLPRDRIKYFIESRSKILTKLKVNGIAVDESVTADPFRIMRLPGSVNYKSKKICLELSHINQLLSDDFVARITLENSN